MSRPGAQYCHPKCEFYDTYPHPMNPAILAVMEVLVCRKCGKAKSSALVDEEDKRITGKKILKKLSAWLEKHPELAEAQLKIRETGCMDQCKKSPAIFIKQERRFVTEITKKKLKELKEYLMKVHTAT